MNRFSYQKIILTILLCHNGFMSIKKLKSIIHQNYKGKLKSLYTNRFNSILYRYGTSLLLLSGDIFMNSKRTMICLTKYSKKVKKINNTDCSLFIRSEKERRIIYNKLELVKLLY
jgi:hypothetical protein